MHALRISIVHSIKKELRVYLYTFSHGSLTLPQVSYTFTQDRGTEEVVPYIRNEIMIK